MSCASLSLYVQPIVVDENLHIDSGQSRTFSRGLPFWAGDHSPFFEHFSRFFCIPIFDVHNFLNLSVPRLPKNQALLRIPKESRASPSLSRQGEQEQSLAEV